MSVFDEASGEGSSPIEENKEASIQALTLSKFNLRMSTFISFKKL